VGDHIKYKSGYKYQLVETYCVQIPIRPKNNIETEYISLAKSGLLIIREGYAWDGPSGPTIDTKTFMRGSSVHDALYQLMREGLLSRRHRNDVDKLLARMCLQDGMFFGRAWWVHVGVKYGAAGAAKKKAMRPVLIAP